MCSEFDIIHRFFKRNSTHPATILGIGDDAALIKPTDGMELAISTDTLVAERHFFSHVDPEDLGYKSLAVNLSDMAAMGATPRWATLSLTLPQSIAENDAWLTAFTHGFFNLAQTHQVELIGGDTTSGSLSICIQILGEIEHGKALRRSNAQAGDDIWVSGHLGDAALALANEQKRIILKSEEVQSCLPALNRPQARVKLGQKLINAAHSAIDVSDGLMADLGHILKQSNVAACINIDMVPCSNTLRTHLPQPLAQYCLLAGGDDYELCFTAPKARRTYLKQLSQELMIPLTIIGNISAGKGLRVKNTHGQHIMLESKGYDHFHA